MIDFATATEPPQIFVKAIWPMDGGAVKALVGGNLDSQPRTVQVDVLNAAIAALRTEAERFGIK